MDISHVSAAEAGPEALYAITFTLLSGELIATLSKQLKSQFVIHIFGILLDTQTHYSRVILPLQTV